MMGCRLTAWFVAVFLALVSSATAERITDIHNRLPDSVWPIDYDLHIKTDHRSDSFKGLVKITVAVNETTDEIRLHSRKKSIRIESVTVCEDNENGRQLKVDRFYHPASSNFSLTIKLADDNKLTSGRRYSVAISYDGSFVGFNGYYKQSFEIDGRISNFSATKFYESFPIGAYAFRAFPCFEEPRFKATFRISIKHDKNLVALSNMPVDDNNNDGQESGDQKTTVFMRSPVKIPTQFIGWAVGEFQSTEQFETSSGVKIRAFARPGRVDQTSLLVSWSVKLIETYERLFGVSYPLPKLDLLMTPVLIDGLTGLNTVGLNNLRSDDGVLVKRSSVGTLLSTAKKLANHLAFNWFGSLVTNSLDEVGFNEGLALISSGKALTSAGIDGIASEFYDRWSIDMVQSGVFWDNLMSSVPIVTEPLKDLLSPNSSDAVFVNNFKAGAVFRMIEDTVGQSAFQSAVNNYLAKNKNSVAGVGEFLAELQQQLSTNSNTNNEFSGKINNIRDFLSKWLFDNNLPLVSVSRKSTGDGLLVRQERFLTVEDDNIKQHHPHWNIPIKVITGSGATASFILSKQSAEIEIKIAADDWFKLNPGHVGYYIVDYGAEEWKRLTAVLCNNPSVMSPADRANLLHDAFSLAKEKRINYSLVFELTEFLARDEHPIPWDSASLASLLSNEDNQEELTCFRQHVQRLTSNLYLKLGWNDERQHDDSFEKRMLRAQIIELSCENGVDDCLDAASDRLTKLIRNPDTTEVGPDSRNVIYKYGIRRRGPQISNDDWQCLLKMYANETLAEQQVDLLNALANVQSPELLRQLFEATLTGSGPISKDIGFRLFYRVLETNPVLKHIVWPFLRDNYHRAVEKGEDNPYRLSMVVFKAIGKLDRPEHIEEVTEFFKRNPTVQPEQKYRVRMLDRIKKNIKAKGKGETTNCLNWKGRAEVKRTSSDQPSNDVAAGDSSSEDRDLFGAFAALDFLDD